MAVSPYFSRGHIGRKSEQDLMESLVIENIQLFGQDVAYIPMENFETDSIIRDPKNIVFDKHYIIEGYLPENAQVQGNDDLMSKFGFRQERTLDLYISKKRFIEVTGKRRPLEGDLIMIATDYSKPYDTYMNDIYEIHDVDYQAPEWTLGKNYTYKITLHSWVNNFESFKTGVEGIDALDFDAIESQAKRPAEVEKEVTADANALVRFDRKNPLSGI